MEKAPVCGMLVRSKDAAEQRVIRGRTCYFWSAARAAKLDWAPSQCAGEYVCRRVWTPRLGERCLNPVNWPREQLC